MHQDQSILITDDHSMFSESLRTVIMKHLPEIHTINLACSSKEAHQKLGHSAYSLVLLDIRLASEEHTQGQHNAGLRLCQFIREEYPQSKVLMLSAYSDHYLIQQAQLLGAHGYLLKELPVQALIIGIHRVLSGGLYFDYAVNYSKAEQQEIAEQISYLHPRVLQMLLAFLDRQGPSNQELAEIMGLKEKTVRNYFSQVYDQLDLHSRSKLLLWLQEHEMYLRQKANEYTPKNAFDAKHRDLY